MKILVLSPFGKTEPFGLENLEKVKRPDTEFDFECLEDVPIILTPIQWSSSVRRSSIP